jgi:diadenosine tetraphosphate (Ap4A) HIT family hydrolase
MIDTLKKFGYPGNLVREYDHWFVLVRPEQVTLGALVLIEKSGAHSFSQIPPESFAELGRVITDAETILAAEFRYDKLNYLMLMMVDPEVHFHLIPRYSEGRSFGSINFKDWGWPGLPELGQINDVPVEVVVELVSRLQLQFSQRASSQDSH